MWKWIFRFGGLFQRRKACKGCIAFMMSPGELWHVNDFDHDTWCEYYEAEEGQSHD